jgi:hypothetical protein
MKALQLAASINIGLEILESPQGKTALNALGHSVMHSWDMPSTSQGLPIDYAHHFLSAVRNDFPHVTISNLEGLNALAVAERTSGAQ